jgi:hypothetical protein
MNFGCAVKCLTQLHSYGHAPTTVRRAGSALTVSSEHVMHYTHAYLVDLQKQLRNDGT